MEKQEDSVKTSLLSSNEKSMWGLPKSVVSFVIIAVTSALVYRLITVQVTLQFDFSAFLSLLLALFAVILSALFYFKTTETSNAFYDNTHKFTREVSQILGRIEAGFGERLRHLDEGYTGLRDKFEKLPFDVSKAREQEKEEKEEVAKKEAEIQNLLNNLAERAQLAETEKQELFSRLRQTQEELATSKNELRHLQSRIRHAEEPSDIHPDFRRDLTNFLKNSFHAYRVPTKFINREFSRVLNEFDAGPRHYMQRHDLLDSDGDLTKKGENLVSEILREIESNQ